MKAALFLGVACAVLIHAGILLFGGILFAGLKKDEGSLQTVELLAPDEPEKDDEEPEDPEPAEEQPEMETEVEEPPDAAEIIKSLEIAETDATPALEAASLSAIADALSGGGGGGDFAQALDFASGGRIGGTGKAGGLDETLDQAFSLAEIDQKPRVVFQAAPLYPAGMRGKKLEAVVTVLFVVDGAGKVNVPRIESTTNSAFDKPALDAVKKWKFEPAVKGGERVSCKMRVPIRFQPN